jgi:2-oxoglutarate dehydrogenase complex dehydrogenase (E1) component-like enzyme
MGMAHRGRLNTLTNIFKKQPRDIFSEFEGKEFDFESAFDGDVKYHQGFTSNIVLDNGKKMGLTLAPNPSHLEAVNTVVEGIARAKIDHVYKDEKKVCPVLIHGDAAIAGQGIVYETIQMAQLAGYRAGGTIHIIVNNQVGFTTIYIDARSSTYCTDIAKTTLCPVFHVNGEQNAADRKALLDGFKTAPKSLITNARCLTEGVDVPAVDMVAFVDPRKSKIDIAQAAGRAMRQSKATNKRLGYIVVPLFVEQQTFLLCQQ